MQIIVHCKQSGIVMTFRNVQSVTELVLIDNFIVMTKKLNVRNSDSIKQKVSKHQPDFDGNY